MSLWGLILSLGQTVASRPEEAQHTTKRALSHGALVQELAPGQAKRSRGKQQLPYLLSRTRYQFANLGGQLLNPVIRRSSNDTTQCRGLLMSVLWVAQVCRFGWPSGLCPNPPPLVVKCDRGTAKCHPPAKRQTS